MADKKEIWFEQTVTIRVRVPYREGLRLRRADEWQNVLRRSVAMSAVVVEATITKTKEVNE